MGLWPASGRSQHGAPMQGAAVQEFIAWAESLPCGVDLMSERDYAVPA